METPPRAPTMGTEPEHELDHRAMARLQAGHDDALDELMERHAGRLCAYLRRMLNREEDAEDVAQEVFVRVYQKRDRFDAKHPFAAWLYAIAGNLVRDRYRWRSRHGEVSLEALSGETGGTPSLLEAAPATLSTATPEGDALRRETADAVQAAVQALPPDLREAIVLSEFEERSHEEIGGILGCSAKAVEMRLYRARAELRKRLARWLGQGETGRSGGGGK